MEILSISGIMSYYEAQFRTVATCELRCTYIDRRLDNMASVDVSA